MISNFCMGRIRRFLCCCFATEGRKVDPSKLIQAAPVTTATLVNPALPSEEPSTADTTPVTISTADSSTEETPINDLVTEEVDLQEADSQEVETQEIVSQEVVSQEVVSQEVVSQEAETHVEQGISEPATLDVSDEDLPKYTNAADQLIQAAAAGLLERGACGINPRDRSHLAAVGRELDEMCTEGDEYSQLVLTVAAAALCGDADKAANLTQLAREAAFAFAAKAFQAASAKLPVSLVESHTSVPMPSIVESESEPLPLSSECEVPTPHQIEGKNVTAILEEAVTFHEAADEEEEEATTTEAVMTEAEATETAKDAVDEEGIYFRDANCGDAESLSRSSRSTDGDVAQNVEQN